MPATPKMHIFEREIRRDDDLFAAWHRQHGGIVADSNAQRSLSLGAAQSTLAKSA
jgi:hypothetical protein